MKFSQRIGKTPVQTTIQKDTMSDSFINRLKNKIDLIITLKYESTSFYINPDFKNAYCNHFGYRETDWSIGLTGFIQKLCKINDVYLVYDNLEFLVGYLTIKKEKKIIIQQFNDIFELEKSAYRFDKSGQLIAITEEIELAELNMAINSSNPYPNVYMHLEKARNFFSNREQPDYDKTIVESVHAIEAVCKIITNNEKATLGSTLKNMNLHNALECSISKLYGFSSDTVRHATKPNNTKIDENDARLILITSHSIVNYLISKNL